MDSRPGVWELEPHTKVKHEIMRRYLGAWFAILGSWHGRILFIDGFAGPGRYDSGEPGSPIIAMNTLLEHRDKDRLLDRCEFVFFFCEPDGRRFPVLQRTITEFAGGRGGLPTKVQVEAVDQSFGDAIDAVLDQLRAQKAALAPTFAFVDPFGIKGIEMRQIAELLSFPRGELLVNLATQSMGRFTNAPEFEQHMDALFGTDEWRAASDLTAPERRTFFRDLYTRQLHDLCGFEHTLDFEMIGSGGQHSYFLIYATRHPKGLEVMKDAMWGMDPTGGYQFSSRAAGQQVLFTGDALDTGPLRAALLTKFAGHTVSIEELERFVVCETPYKKTHLKKLTLKLMEDDGLLGPVTGRTREGTYPSGTRISFPA
jgi:three-Cys-motif partner protein